ncbi:chorion peroxidase-like [Folsomia candida]|nr:chorion peroxidase-like [Folsomia candida]
MLTSFVDGSNIYGSEDERHAFIRSFEKGKLRVNSANSKFPPTNAEIEAVFGTKPMVLGTFLAGDDRVNEMPGLLVMHTLWFREHNRIAEGIYNLMPFWDDEFIFQETRRLVLAEWQNVVYGEYLPTLLGMDTMNKYGLTLRDWWSNYDPNVDATVFHAFADAAYRFGHTFSNGIIQLYRGLENIGSYRIRHNFFVDTQVVQDGGKGYDYILNGLLIQNAQTYDPFVTEDLTNHVLQLPTDDFGSDLIARNFQRGRDHGLPAWMEFRRLCGLETTTSWLNKPVEVVSDSWLKLQGLFQNPNEVDLFTGGIIEVPMGEALTGPTFNCLKVSWE